MASAVTSWLRQQVQVARVYGIPVRVDYRWFVVFVLSVWLMASNLHNGAGVMRGVPWIVAWVMGLLTTIGFFLCIFGHELAHALVARREGIATEEIVLHPYGGLARLKHAPETPRAEFFIALAGPVASLGFALLLGFAAVIASAGGYALAQGCFYLLFFGNLLLAIFNLFPGYPLDGGRVLRAWLWGRTGDIDDATRKASRLGQFIALAIVALGIFLLLRFFWNRSGDLFTGLWSILIGLFLRDAAAAGAREAEALQATAGETMSAPIALEPEGTISHFVDHTLPLYRQTAFPVAQGKRLHGILLLSDLKKWPRERWRTVRVKEAMRPVSPQMFVALGTPLRQARDLMKQNQLGAVAVLDEKGLLVGFLHSAGKAMQ